VEEEFPRIRDALEMDGDFLSDFNEAKTSPPVSVFGEPYASVVNHKEVLDTAAEWDVGMSANENLSLFLFHHMEETLLRPVGKEVLIDAAGTSVDKEETVFSELYFIPGEKLGEELLVLLRHYPAGPSEREMSSFSLFLTSVGTTAIVKVKTHSLIVIAHDGGNGKTSYTFNDLIRKGVVSHKIAQAHYFIRLCLYNYLKHSLQGENISVEVRKNGNFHLINSFGFFLERFRFLP